MKRPRLKKRQSFFDPISIWISEIIVQSRWLIVFMSILTIGAMASGSQYLEFSNNYRIFFSDENPELVAFETFQNTYSKNDNILLVVHPKSGALFTPKNIAAVEELTARAWDIPFASRVD